MSATAITCALVVSLIAGLLFSHLQCRRGAMSACLLVSSLPTDVHVRLLNAVNYSGPTAEELGPHRLGEGWQLEAGALAEAQGTVVRPGLNICTDAELNRPEGEWIMQDHPPYGYRCKWMQANYGCEKAPPVPLKWQPLVATAGKCAYADWTPIGAARARAQRVPGKAYPIVVVIVGDSFLRQVVEALACRFEHLVTVRKVPGPGPKLPKDGPLAARPLRDAFGLCTNPDERFQNPPYRTPPEPCSDDAAVIRFGQDLVVYFLWRASSTLQAVRWFGLNIPDISVVVSQPRIWTGGGGHPRFDIAQLVRWGFNGTLVLITRGEARGSYPRCLTISVIRLRDDARSDGGHVCLPGSPDDAVRLMLGMIATPTKFGVACDLPEQDYRTDGTHYLPLSSRGQLLPGGPNLATSWVAGFRFHLSEDERERFKAEYKGPAPRNKTLHDVDDWIEASYNRTYQL
eukprot:GGOE01019504.1.p1 GENE.GGOE01019504.1~~GGOE01019504.1.p1  ORF type:complete len:476 (-),score=80.22 GGOE01019504.1:72-1445(-)